MDGLQSVMPKRRERGKPVAAFSGGWRGKRARAAMRRMPGNEGGRGCPDGPSAGLTGTAGPARGTGRRTGPTETAEDTTCAGQAQRALSGNGFTAQSRKCRACSTTVSILGACARARVDPPQRLGGYPTIRSSRSHTFDPARGGPVAARRNAAASLRRSLQQQSQKFEGAPERRRLSAPAGSAWPRPAPRARCR